MDGNIILLVGVLIVLYFVFNPGSNGVTKGTEQKDKESDKHHELSPDFQRTNTNSKEKTEKQLGNKKILIGLGILIFGSAFGYNVIGGERGFTITGIFQLVGIVYVLLGMFQRGSFNNAGEQIENYRILKGRCPKCGNKIGYTTYKCPYCTADL